MEKGEKRRGMVTGVFLGYYNSPPESDQQIVSHSKVSLCLMSTPALGLITNAISAVYRKELTQTAWLLLSLERSAYVVGLWLATEILFSDGSYHPIWSECLLYLHCLWGQWGLCWGRHPSVILGLWYMPGRVPMWPDPSNYPRHWVFPEIPYRQHSHVLPQIMQRILNV